MKPRAWQYLIIKGGTRGNGGTRIKIWYCKYVGCKRVLNDLDNHMTTKWCKFHKELVETEKNRRCYVKRVGKVQDFQKNQLLLYLLKNNTTVSKYQILAYTHIKNMDSVRSQLTFLRRRGHKITRRMDMYSLEE